MIQRRLLLLAVAAATVPVAAGAVAAVVTAVATAAAAAVAVVIAAAAVAARLSRSLSLARFEQCPEKADRTQWASSRSLVARSSLPRKKNTVLSLLLSQTMAISHTAKMAIAAINEVLPRISFSSTAGAT